MKTELMERKGFCKSLATTAASARILSFAQSLSSDHTELPEDFNRYTKGYAEFCASPPEKRVFYQVSDGGIVPTMLDEADWRQRAWNYSPAPSQIAGGMWDDVPLASPIPNLGGERPFKPTWDSLLEYETPDWYRDAKFGIWAHWSPQCVAEAGGWCAVISTSKGSGSDGCQRRSQLRDATMEDLRRGTQHDQGRFVPGREHQQPW
jgi:alpha-L-fucosidase